MYQEYGVSESPPALVSECSAVPVFDAIDTGPPAPAVDTAAISAGLRAETQATLDAARKLAGPEAPVQRALTMLQAQIWLDTGAAPRALAAIEAGRKTAEGIILTMSSKYVLSEAQKKQLRDVKKTEDETVEGETV